MRTSNKIKSMSDEEFRTYKRECARKTYRKNVETGKYMCHICDIKLESNHKLKKHKNTTKHKYGILMLSFSQINN